VHAGVSPERMIAKARAEREREPDDRFLQLVKRERKNVVNMGEKLFVCLLVAEGFREVEAHEQYDAATMHFKLKSESHVALIGGLTRIGIPFEFKNYNYKAIFLGQLELYNELLKCFEMQLTPEHFDSEENLEKLKKELITTIDTVWKKCCRDPEPFKGLDENTYTSFKDCYDLVTTLVNKSAQPPRSAEPEIISTSSGT
jgi:hypothetical protein